MTAQYSLVNQCLALLKQADMQPIKKLRIEIQLIQMKRLLLNEDALVESCEDTLLEVLSDIGRIRKGEHDQDIVGSLMGRLGHLLDVPKGEQ